jgi:hypothetical protein
MRTIAGWMLLCGVALAAAPNAVAGEQEEALALVDRAVKAHGGADALNKAQALVRSGTGTMTLFGNTSSFTDEVTWSLPDRLRLAMEVEKKYRLTMVVNGDKGWQSAGGPTVDLGPARLAEVRDEMYVLWLTTLMPLKQTAFKLSPLPEIKVNGAAAVGVKVMSKDKADVKLYFDKKTNLLVKIERRATEGGQKVDKEYFYSDHKDFDGVKLPTKQSEWINGRKFSELTGATYKFPKKLEEAVFAKP